MSGRPPLHGYNTNYRREGTLYHVQTEDLGDNFGAIVTQVFAGGTILAARRTDYRHLFDDADPGPALQKMMQRQHKEMLLGLRDGSLELSGAVEELLGDEALAVRSHDTIQMEIPPDFIEAPDPEAAIREIEARTISSLPPPPDPSVEKKTEVESLQIPAPVEDLRSSHPANPPPEPPPAREFRPPSTIEGSFEEISEQIPLPARKPSSLPPLTERGSSAPDAPPSRVPEIFRKVSRPAPGLGEDRLAEEQLGERSLDEVILSYLAEELQEDS